MGEDWWDKMSYAHGNAAAMNEQLCRYGESKLVVRGPQRELGCPYLAFLGSTEVYGRFIETPFPADVETLLGLPCVNFAAVNGGLDSYFYDPTLREMAACADVAVIQAMGAQNISNAFYNVHPRRNDRFLRANPPLLDLFPDVDFTEFHFNRHMLSRLHAKSADRFAKLRAHLQATWLERMHELVSGFDGSVVLLWLRYELDLDNAFAQEPVLVNQQMVDQLRHSIDGVIELQVATAGAANDVTGMVAGQRDLPAARLMIGPKEQRRIACEVAEQLQQMV